MQTHFEVINRIILGRYFQLLRLEEGMRERGLRGMGTRDINLIRIQTFTKKTIKNDEL